MKKQEEYQKILILAKDLLVSAIGSCIVNDENIETDDIYHVANMIERFANTLVEQPKKYYPDTEANGYVFCGKCGKMKGI